MFITINDKCVKINTVNNDICSTLTVSTNDSSMRIQIQNEGDQTVSIPLKKVNSIYKFTRDILRKIKTNNIKKPTSFGCIHVSKNRKIDLVFTYEDKKFLLNISTLDTNAYILLDFLEFCTLYGLILSTYIRTELKNTYLLVHKNKSFINTSIGDDAIFAALSGVLHKQQETL